MNRMMITERHYQVPARHARTDAGRRQLVFTIIAASVEEHIEELVEAAIETANLSPQDWPAIDVELRRLIDNMRQGKVWTRA